jgi:hypothetical protein
MGADGIWLALGVGLRSVLLRNRTERERLQTGQALPECCTGASNSLSRWAGIGAEATSNQTLRIS